MDPEIAAAKAPWTTGPNTVEEMLAASAAQHAWENEHGPAPYHWCIMVKRTFIDDMCIRLLAIETTLFGGE